MMRAVLAVLLAVVAAHASAADELKPGLIGEYFEMSSGVADFPKLPAERKPTIKRVDKKIEVNDTTENFNNTNLDTDFYVRWTGSLKIEKAGKYKLFVESDDGTRLFVDGKQVIENGGSHPEQKRECVLELTP